MALWNQLLTFFKEKEETRRLTAAHPQVLRVVLLLEAATYDSHFAQEERTLIEKLLAEKYHIDAEALESLLQLANERRARQTDIYGVTRELNQQMSGPDKIELMTEIWQVILADGAIDKREDLFARKMQNLLNLDHPTWIQTKIEAVRRSSP